MALLKMEGNFEEFEFISKLRKQFPEFRRRMLGYVAARGMGKTGILKKQFLSGQELNLRIVRVKDMNRPTLNYYIAKNSNSVTMTSFPLNLFENGRRLRNGKTEPGKKIMTRKFKQAMLSNLSSLVNEFDTKFLQGEFDKY